MCNKIFRTFPVCFVTWWPHMTSSQSDPVGQQIDQLIVCLYLMSYLVTLPPLKSTNHSSGFSWFLPAWFCFSLPPALPVLLVLLFALLLLSGVVQLVSLYDQLETGWALLLRDRTHWQLAVGNSFLSSSFLTEQLSSLHPHDVINGLQPRSSVLSSSLLRAAASLCWSFTFITV